MLTRKKKFIVIGILGIIIVAAAIVMILSFMKLRKGSYADVLKELPENCSTAVIMTNAEHPVLLVSDGTYAYENWQASIYCQVYYLVNGKAQQVGEIISFGTAYPIAYDETGIYIGSGHGMGRYEVTEEGQLVLAESVVEEIKTDGSVTYTRDLNGKLEEITIAQWNEAILNWKNAEIANFN